MHKRQWELQAQTAVMLTRTWASRPRTTFKAKDLDPKAKAKDLSHKAKAKDLDFGLKDQGQGLTSLTD